MKNTLIKLLATLVVLFSFPAWATESVEGSTVPVTTATITDFFGHAWTLTQDPTRTVKRDGVATNMTDVQEVWYLGHSVYTFTAGTGWHVFGPGSAIGVATPVSGALQFWQNMPKTPGTRAPTGPQTGGSCSGTNITSGQTIQTFVNASPVNTVFCIGVGTYTGQSVTPKAGQQFIGAYSGGSGYALMDGNGTATQAFTGTADHVVIQNIKMTNYNNATQDGIVQVTGDWLLLKNNVITLSIQGAGIHLRGDYAAILSNQITTNAQEGYSGSGIDPAHSAIGFLFDNNEIGGNNPTHVLWNGAEQGGGKLVFTDNSTFWYNSAHDNGGAAFWTDANHVDTKYWFNSSINDTGGIEHEISFNASIIGNVFTGTGSNALDSGCTGFFVACASIAIENSGGILPPNTRPGIIEVAYNTIKPGQYGRSFTFRQQPRGNLLPSDGWFSVGPLTVRNVWFHNNVVDMTAATANADQVGIGTPVDDTSVFSFGNVKFDYNTYKLNGATPFLWALGSISFADWQLNGNDVHGQVIP